MKGSKSVLRDFIADRLLHGFSGVNREQLGVGEGVYTLITITAVSNVCE
jgi:hypothetical protein